MNLGRVPTAIDARRSSVPVATAVVASMSWRSIVAKNASTTAPGPVLKYCSNAPCTYASEPGQLSISTAVESAARSSVSCLSTAGDEITSTMSSTTAKSARHVAIVISAGPRFTAAPCVAFASSNTLFASSSAVASGGRPVT